MCDCNKNKYINNEYINSNKIKEEFTENFSLEKPKDLCHYTCSEINMTNIILVILIIILIYLIVRK